VPSRLRSGATCRPRCGERHRFGLPPSAIAALSFARLVRRPPAIALLPAGLADAAENGVEVLLEIQAEPGDRVAARLELPGGVPPPKRVL